MYLIPKKTIVIEPFDSKQVNPNSYDFRLGGNIYVYKNKILDVKKKNQIKKISIPKTGYVLKPDKLYLGHTVERIGTDKYVPIIRGKSSTGRVGLFVHITADLIDIGYNGQYTLMLHAVQPVRIYANMRIGQVTFWKIKGSKHLYEGKYQNGIGPQASKIHKDFLK